MPAQPLPRTEEALDSESQGWDPGKQNREMKYERMGDKWRNAEETKPVSLKRCPQGDAGILGGQERTVVKTADEQLVPFMNALPLQ